MHDVRYAVRLMMRQPLFASLVIATLTLGIGASTTMFSVVNGVLLEPLPYGDPKALVWMFGAFRLSDTAAVSPPDFVDYRDRNDAFERLGAMGIAPEGVIITGIGEPARLQASTVSADLMTTLGVPPMLGRDFTRSDETVGSSAVIISDRLWQERFERSRTALGRSIVVDGRARTIVGVMPAGFTLPYDSFIRLTDPVDLYLPLALDDATARIRRFHSLRVIGRLKPDSSLQRAQSQMDVIARQLAATYPENETWHLRLLPLRERIVGSVRPVLWVLTTAVALLLLLSCANVASLLLARAGARESELALRGALGASRARVVRQLLVEGLALSLAGGAAGLLVSWWTVGVLKRIGPARFPRLDAIGIDTSVVAFALAAAAATTLIFGLVPAIHAARGHLAAIIRPGRAATQDRSRRLGQRMLVAAQLSVSFVLLTGAALLVRGFVELISIETGFSAEHVMMTRVLLPTDRYEAPARIEAYYSALLERLAATPGIDAAALGSAPPMSGAMDSVVYRPGRRPAGAADRRFTQVRWIQGDYFAALGIPLVAGRAFDARADGPGAPAAAIISRRAAREYFGTDAAVGQQLVIDLGQPVTANVVGVTGDVRIFGQANEPPPILYLHARQRPFPNLHVIVKSGATPSQIASIVREHVVALDPSLAVSRIERMETLLADSVAEPRFSMLLIGSFPALALALTLVGVYATLAYVVKQRRREIGIRVAVGATRRDIRRMILRQGAALLAIGLPPGIVASLWITRYASSLLSALRPPDSVVLSLVTVLLGVTTLAAVLIPASAAARVEPLEALRGE